MAIGQDKARLRASLRASRRAMSHAEVAAKSEAIVARLLGWVGEAEADVWFVYVSVGHEVATRALIERLLGQGRRVCVPRVAGAGAMEAIEVASLGELVVGPMRIPQPPPQRRRCEGRVDVAVVPGVGFTAACDRLGGGLGFYDRWLTTHTPRLAVGLAFELQVVAQLPVEAHDVRLHAIVTEQAVYVKGGELSHSSRGGAL